MFRTARLHYPRTPRWYVTSVTKACAPAHVIHDSTSCTYASMDSAILVYTMRECDNQRARTINVSDRILSPSPTFMGKLRSQTSLEVSKVSASRRKRVVQCCTQGAVAGAGTAGKPRSMYKRIIRCCSGVRIALAARIASR
jgi:hypothetical protein